MRKARTTLPIVLTAMAMSGLLAVAGHAAKPVPTTFPTLVKLTGGIELPAPDYIADPTHARVTFVGSAISFNRNPKFPDSTTGQVFISNPDYTPGTSPYTPSLHVIDFEGGKALQYFFCAHKTHETDGLTRCEVRRKHDGYYYCLVIQGGTVVGTTAVFPVGSLWFINSKIPYTDTVRVADGQLGMDVKYEIKQ